MVKQTPAMVQICAHGGSSHHHRLTVASRVAPVPLVPVGTVLRPKSSAYEAPCQVRHEKAGIKHALNPSTMLSPSLSHTLSLSLSFFLSRSLSLSRSLAFYLPVVCTRVLFLSLSYIFVSCKAPAAVNPTWIPQERQLYHERRRLHPHL